MLVSIHCVARGTLQKELFEKNQPNLGLSRIVLYLFAPVCMVKLYQSGIYHPVSSRVLLVRGYFLQHMLPQSHRARSRSV